MIVGLHFYKMFYLFHQPFKVAISVRMDLQKYPSVELVCIS